MRLIIAVFGMLLRRLSLPAILFLVGWYAGAKYGAPDLLMRAADGVVARATAVLSPILGRAAEQSSDYVVGTVEQMLEGLAESGGGPGEPDKEAAEEGPAQPGAPEEEPAAEEPPAPAPGGAAAAEGDIILCKMQVSNPPNASGGVVRKSGSVRIKGVNLLLMPATKACLSSGYGYRSGKLHKGVDYYSDTGGDALAGGFGVIAEAVSRSDYGNMIVIDHGNGVYTRYGHLARFGSGIRKGATVKSGQVLGPIGKTGASSIIHLHYEVLTGDIETRAGSFGLDTVDPFSLPSAN